MIRVLGLGCWVLALGVWLPWRLGFSFLDAATLLFYGCLAAPFAAPGSEERVSLFQQRPDGVRWRHQLVRRAAWGFAAAQGLLVLGLIMVNVAGGHRAPVLPPAGVWAGVTMASLAAALLAAAAEVVRTRVWMLLAGGVLANQLLPGERRDWWDAQLTPGRLARDGALLLLVAFGYTYYRYRSRTGSAISRST